MTSKECLYAILDMLNHEQVDECEKNNYFKIIKQDLDKLEIATKNDEGLIRDNVKLIKRVLELQDENQGVKDDNTRLWHGLEYANNEVAKLKKAIEILKNGFEIVLCESDFPIFDAEYSIGFKINNDGVYTHVSQKEYELLEEVFNYG